MIGRVPLYYIARRGFVSDSSVKIEFITDPKYLIQINDRAKIQRVKTIYQSGSYLEKPFFVGSGIVLITEDNKFILNIRSVNADFYPLKIQDFAGILKYNYTIRENALNALIRELLIYTNDGDIILPQIPGIKTGKRELMEFENNIRLIQKFDKTINGEIINVDIEPIKICDTFQEKFIHVYENGKPKYTDKTYAMYESSTNTLEVLYTYKIPFESSELNVISLEHMASPVIFVNKITLLYSSKAHFTPRLFNLLIVPLRKCL